MNNAAPRSGNDEEDRRRAGLADYLLVLAPPARLHSVDAAAFLVAAASTLGLEARPCDDGDPSEWTRPMLIDSLRYALPDCPPGSGATLAVRAALALLLALPEEAGGA